HEKYEISDNQIMVSCLLKKYHRHILPDTDKVRLRHPVNLREIHPDIDPMYIGNAFFFSWTEFTKDEIDQLSIYEIAYRLKESIRSARDQNFIQDISYVSKYGIEFKPDMFNHYNATDMDTDILSGISSGLETVLVLSGVTSREDIDKYSYAPNYIYDSVADINPSDLD
ncbi:MAG TPA: HAD hydrolase-like protein, partial [Anaerolineaceae bacterium]|nr:HAD hydrolase-like protein [Anaerolineaceae bacterium]